MDTDDLIDNLYTRRQIREQQLSHWRSFSDPAWQTEIESINAAIQALQFVKIEYDTYGAISDFTRAWVMVILSAVNIFTLGIDE